MLAVAVLLLGLFSNHYVVRFEGAAPVREGMTLVYRGVEIGSVTEVGVGADLKPFAEVKVKHKFRDLFREGCAVSLDRDARTLELTGVDRDRRVLPDGAAVPGLAGPMDYLRFGYETVKGRIRDLKLQKEYETLQREMSEAWEQGKGKFQEAWPQFKRRLRDMKDQVGPELKEEFEKLEEAWEKKAK